MISILVPTCGRADRLAAVAANIHESLTSEHEAEVVFIIEADDEPSRSAVVDFAAGHPGWVTRLVINERARSYAGATNTAYRQGLGEYVFCASDDLRFALGWDEAALRVMASSDHVQVVGTNDLLNPYVARGWHATHYLIDRRYLDDEGGVLDEGPGSFLFEGYDHQFTDTEFIGTAKARARFQPCFDSIVEHMHFLAGKNPKDDRYDRAYANEGPDGEIYEARKHQWWSLSR